MNKVDKTVWLTSAKDWSGRRESNPRMQLGKLEGYQADQELGRKTGAKPPQPHQCVSGGKENRHPADRLHELREQIRILKTEEQELRRAFISGDLPRDGDDYTVTVEVKPNERIDLEQMREYVEESIWKPFLAEKPVVYVNVRRKQ